MKLFFDTSALVKYFHNEQGSQQVIELIENKNNKIWVSDLARIEFVSALHRKFRNKELDMLQLNEALKGFDSEWNHFHVQPLGDAVITTADKLLRENADQYKLRALDAIHFASFVLLAEKNWVFVVADSLLADAVAANQFKVIRIALP
jgi:predicted nucleic acid-binding protein